MILHVEKAEQTKNAYQTPKKDLDKKKPQTRSDDLKTNGVYLPI